MHIYVYVSISVLTLFVRWHGALPGSRNNLLIFRGFGEGYLAQL